LCPGLLIQRLSYLEFSKKKGFFLLVFWEGISYIRINGIVPGWGYLRSYKSDKDDRIA
jgi:hypothetical protein